MGRKRKQAASLPEPSSFSEVLDQAGERPSDDADAGTKRNYADAFSNRVAVWLAGHLRRRKEFKRILPNADGSGRESKVAAGAVKKPKKLDVRFSTEDTGLELLVSVKSLNFKTTKKVEGKTVVGRYTKNMVRNDHELRAEAMDLHERFPYAVLVAILFLPTDACEDAKAGAEDKSSFAHAVLTLRPRAGRQNPSDAPWQFERVFIGLYDRASSDRGKVIFFDVTAAPPRRGHPAAVTPTGCFDVDALVKEIVKTYGIRNRRYIEWADAAPGRTAPMLEEPPVDEADDDDDAESVASG